MKLRMTGHLYLAYIPDTLSTYFLANEAMDKNFPGYSPVI